MISSRYLDSISARAFAAGALALVTMTLAGPARAQAQRDAAAGEELFKKARDLVDQGDWKNGCAKFDAAMAANPTTSTLLNIARCHEHDGKIASAWADAKRALVLNAETVPEERRRGLEDLTKQKIADLEKRLPRLRLTVDKKYPDLKITRDGQVLPGDGVLGEALPTDPGSHEIEATATGFIGFRSKVTVEEGKTLELGIAMSAAPPGAVAPPAADTGQPATASGGIPIWVWFAAGGGIALAGASVGFRIDGAAAENTIDANCTHVGDQIKCFTGGSFDVAPYTARKNRDLALTIGFAAGSAIAIGAAIVGIVTAPPRAPKTAAVRVAPWGDARGVTVLGVF